MSHRAALRYALQNAQSCALKGRWRLRWLVKLSRFLSPMLTLPLVLSGCGDVAGFFAPRSGGNTGDARSDNPGAIAGISIRTSIPVFLGPQKRTNSVAFAAASLRIMTTYQRGSGAEIVIGESSIALGDAAEQQVPVTVDLASCLADGQRNVGNSSESVCPVFIMLNLSLDGVLVDAQRIGPLQLRAGSTTTVDQPVALYVLDSIAILPGANATLDTVGGISIMLSQQTQLSARVFDSQGTSVEGRPVTWSSSSPQVATVDSASGSVIAVAVGTTAIRARRGAVSTQTLLRVVRPPALLTIASEPGSGSGHVRSVPDGIDCELTPSGTTGRCSHSFAGDAGVTLTSTADSGSRFVGWPSGCGGLAVGANCQVIMSEAKTVAAKFLAVRRVQITSGSSDGRGVVTSSSGIDCQVTRGQLEGICAVDVVDGSQISLVATAARSSGSTFEGWHGDCQPLSNDACFISVNGANRTATAHFFVDKSLSVSLAGDGSGRVTAEQGIDCTLTSGESAGTCTVKVQHGSRVMLNASPQEGALFKGWYGDCADASSLICETLVDRASTVGARFERDRVSLTLSLSGSGAGSILINGIKACEILESDASSVCTQTFNVGASITISGVASPGSLFTGLGGSCTSDNCTLTMDAAKNVSAMFTRNQTPLTILLSGEGAGTLTLDGVSACSKALGEQAKSCIVNVGTGHTYTVRPISGEGSRFEGFGGACDGAICQLTPQGPLALSAVFSRTIVSITVTSAHSGAGSVQVGSAPICNFAPFQGTQSCVRDVPAGTQLTLTAAAILPFTFDGFGAPCGSSSTCTFTANESITVPVAFKVPDVTVTIVGMSGATGSGVLSGSGVSCNFLGATLAGTCSTTVAAGTRITLSALAGVNSALSAWGGACAGSEEARCEFVATGNSSVGVSFVAAITAVVSIGGSGRGTVFLDLPLIPRQASCSHFGVGTTSCLFAIPFGQTGIIRATAANGYRFEGFGGFCDEPGNAPYAECSFRGVGFSRQVTATFSPP